MSSAYIPRELRQRVADQAGHRCGYCRSSEEVTGLAMEIEHLMPRALGGLTREENLWLACSACNSFKGHRISGRDPQSGRMVRLFNPRKQSWNEHFAWTDSGTRIRDRTAVGRATVRALRLNRSLLVQARRAWVKAGLHPPRQ